MGEGSFLFRVEFVEFRCRPFGWNRGVLRRFVEGLPQLGLIGWARPSRGLIRLCSPGPAGGYGGLGTRVEFREVALRRDNRRIPINIETTVSKVGY